MSYGALNSPTAVAHAIKAKIFGNLERVKTLKNITKATRTIVYMHDSHMYPPTPVLFEILGLKYYTIYFLLQHKKLKYFFEIASNIDRPLRNTTVRFLEPTSAYLPFPQIQHTGKKP